ncbi:MAG: DUF533 domain-containing protein [bacterium]
MSKGRLDIVKAMAAMAWSDGRMDKKEIEKIRVLAKRMGLEAGDRAKVEGFVRSKPHIDDLDFSELNDKERHAMYLMALHYAHMDGQVKPGEQKVLDKLAELLHVPVQIKAELEQKMNDKK